MAHYFLEKYHGKGISDGICGLFKIMVRNEAWFKDSAVRRRDIMNTHKDVANFGNENFGNKEDNKINMFRFDVLDLGDVNHDAPLQYKPQKYLTSSTRSLLYSDNNADFGDL